MTKHSRRNWSQRRLRLTIAGLWLLSWMLCSAMVILAPVARTPLLHHTDTMPLLVQIAAIWLPSISCLVGFWFAGQQPGTLVPISLERTVAALALTVVYLAFVTIAIGFPLYILDYPETIAVPAGQSLTERMTDSVKYAALLSPIALGPIHWLTGANGTP